MVASQCDRASTTLDCDISTLTLLTWAPEFMFWLLAERLMLVQELSWTVGDGQTYIPAMCSKRLRSENLPRFLFKVPPETLDSVYFIAGPNMWCHYGITTPGTFCITESGRALIRIHTSRYGYSHWLFKLLSCKHAASPWLCSLSSHPPSDCCAEVIQRKYPPQHAVGHLLASVRSSAQICTLQLRYQQQTQKAVSGFKFLKHAASQAQQSLCSKRSARSSKHDLQLKEGWWKDGLRASGVSQRNFQGFQNTWNDLAAHALTFN